MKPYGFVVGLKSGGGLYINMDEVLFAKQEDDVIQVRWKQTSEVQEFTVNCTPKETLEAFRNSI